MRPCASRSAIHAASRTSVLRPGTVRMCWALASTSSTSPSSTCQTGFPRKRTPSGGGRGGRERDLMAELLETAHEVAREAVGGEPIAVLGTEIPVRDAVAQEMVGRHEDGVPDRERGF